MGQNLSSALESKQITIPKIDVKSIATSEHPDLRKLADLVPEMMSNIAYVTYLYNPYINKKYLLFGELHKFSKFVEKKHPMYQEVFKDIYATHLKNSTVKTNIYLEEFNVGNQQHRFPDFPGTPSPNIGVYYNDNFRTGIMNILDYVIGDIWSFDDYNRTRDNIRIAFHTFTLLYDLLLEEFTSERNVQESLTRILQALNVHLEPLNIILSDDIPKIRAGTEVDGLMLYDDKKDEFSDMAVNQIKIFLEDLQKEKYEPNGRPDILKRKNVVRYFETIKMIEIYSHDAIDTIVDDIEKEMERRQEKYYEIKNNSDTKSEADTDTKSEADTDTKSEADSDTKSEADSEGKLEDNGSITSRLLFSNSEDKSDTKSENGSEDKSDTKSEANSDTKSENGSEDKSEEAKKEAKKEAKTIRNLYSDVIYGLLIKISKWTYDISHILTFNKTIPDLAISFCGAAHVPNLVYLLSTLNYRVVKSYQTDRNGDGLTDEYIRNNTTLLMSKPTVVQILTDLYITSPYAVFNNYRDLSVFLGYGSTENDINKLKTVVASKYGYAPDNYDDFKQLLQNYKQITPNPENYRVLGGADNMDGADVIKNNAIIDITVLAMYCFTSAMMFAILLIGLIYLFYYIDSYIRLLPCYQYQDTYMQCPN